MNLQELLWLSYKDISEKKIRTALTIMMVMIGVASIIALISQTEGISSSIQTSLQSLGPTSIIVTSTRPTGFTAADIAQLSSLPDINATIPLLTGSAYVLSNGQNTSATIIGVSPQSLQSLVGQVNLYEGTLYNDTVAPVVVVGHSIAFPSAAAGAQVVTVGNPVTLEITGRNAQTVSVPVAGILQSYGSLIIPVDTGVITSIPAAQILLHRTSYNIILLKATNASSVAEASQLITNIYGSSVNVLTTQQILQISSAIIGSITALLVIIAGISLLVAAIGIMNVMLISVYERTHEIGILKSLGLKNKDILTIFLFQAVIIGFLGGIIGIGVGAGASFGLSYAFTHASSPTGSSGPTTTGPREVGNSGFGGGGGGFGGGGAGSGSSTSISYSPELSPGTVLGALFIAILVSVIAGVYPAWRASKLEPIEALREL